MTDLGPGDAELLEVTSAQLTISTAGEYKVCYKPGGSEGLSLTLILNRTRGQQTSSHRTGDKFVNVTCQDASRIHSSVDRDLPEGLRANTASHCHAPLTLILLGFTAPA